jgi:hypothetical protein
LQSDDGLGHSPFLNEMQSLVFLKLGRPLNYFSPCAKEH